MSNNVFSQSFRPDLSQNTLFGIGSLPSRCGKIEQWHPCAKPKRITGIPCSPEFTCFLAGLNRAEVTKGYILPTSHITAREYHTYVRGACSGSKKCDRRLFTRNWPRVQTAPATGNGKYCKASIQGMKHYHPLRRKTLEVSSICECISHQGLFFTIPRTARKLRTPAYERMLRITSISAYSSYPSHIS